MHQTSLNQTPLVSLLLGLILSACGAGNPPRTPADSARPDTLAAGADTAPAADSAPALDSATGGSDTSAAAGSTARGGDSAIRRGDSAGPPATAEVAPPPGADTLNRLPKPSIDSARIRRGRLTIPDSAIRRDSAKGTASAGSARRQLARGISVADSLRWPVDGPAARPGALLPETLIVAFYGNPYSKRMGILGQIPPAEMMARLERTAAEWARADTVREVRPALHLIATVAQGKPGPGGKYRLQMPDKLIDQVAGWAESKGWLLFLDVQAGHSTVAAELPRFEKYLQRPYVHLALDPEFAMTRGGVPGKRIGTLDAEHVNWAIRWLADIVERNGLPPKVLVVHRFTQPMLTGHDRIRLDPRVQVVVDMDGFGAPKIKQSSYNRFVVPFPIQYTGFKLFYKNDKPMMSPAQVLGLWPVPSYIQYQ